MRKAILAILMAFTSIMAVNATAIGTWTSFMAYGDIKEIQPAGKLVYVLSSKGLFSYNTADNSIETYDKINVLSDCNIAHIAYCKTARRLVILYENQNIDLLDSNGDVVNISDYYNKSMTVDKNINGVSISGQYALISTGFGIIQINIKNAEITATYNLGQKIMSSALAGDYIYAACGKNGILQGKITDNLLDKNNWHKDSDLSVNHIFYFDNKVVAAINGSVYVRENNGWINKNTCYFTFCNDIGGKLVFGQDHIMWVYDDIDHRNTIRQDNYSIKALAYDTDNKCWWSNQADNKLQSLDIENEDMVSKKTDINPDGPKYNYFGFMKYDNNTLYTCGGGFDSFSELLREGTVQTFTDYTWTVYQDDIKEQVKNSFQDLTCMDFDPKDHNHVFVGGRAGLYEYLNGKFIRNYNCDNSPLMYSTPDNNPDYILTLGLKFDKQGNLWCLNSLAQGASILELKADGTWVDHHKTILMDDNNRSLPNMKCMILDSRGLFWFVNNHWSIPSFYGYDPSTEAINHYTTFVNEDGATVNVTGVRCIAEDKEGNMWIGTNVGPLMLPAEDISKGSNYVLQQVKVPRNDGTNFADYLLSGVDITCIAVDGGNRKWFGTNGYGAYLISDDNMEQIQHFLTTNSKLLSDNIESITINDKTGEVFFGTDNGLCSYMSDATATNDNMNSDNVYAYPNPVTPEYTGMITVTGLSMNADVKIATANGTIVAEGTSNGGTFTWDGCDSSGKRVASGVYMVMTATSDGKKGTVCKIAIVN